MDFRLLAEGDIEVRVGQANNYGVSLLLYKNARVDMAILDETVGAAKWQREHYECKGNLYCRVGIDCDGSWVWKSDCGTESNTEAEKGEASDSFKRACVNWGIGRELYTAPSIFLYWDDRSGNPLVTKKEKNGRVTTSDKFIVEKIAYDDKRRIIGLAIINATLNKRVYVYHEGGGDS